MLHRRREELREPSHALWIDEDGVLVDPAAAVIAGDVNEVIVGEEGPAIDESLTSLGG